ncbi:MAG TPA: lytic transglycosylase domain-containing protein [Pyrinomonadaceae bacterium]|nr:lytic transglycosylase domain-containing protein [Pyrinomonadaceae bacterium]
MKKTLPLFALFVLTSLQASAQEGSRYRFDNFDTREGVRVVVPAQAKPARQSRRLRLTARAAERGAASTPASNKSSAAPRPSEASEAVYTPPPLVGVGNSLEGFSTGDASVDRLLVESGTRNGVDPVLLYAIMHRESSFRRMAVSPKGARGLMQLMPATAARFGVSNIFDPRQNIEGGARYVRFLLDTFDGDVRLALAGYNAGEGAVMKYGNRVPPYSETLEYVRRIYERYELMRDPSTARIAPHVSRAQIAKLKAAEPPPLVYERSVFAVRTPDGKLRLVSQ